MVRVVSDAFFLAALTLGALSFAADSRANAPIEPMSSCTACAAVGDSCYGNMLICGHALAPPNYTYTLYPCACCVCSLGEGGSVGCSSGHHAGMSNCGDSC